MEFEAKELRIMPAFGGEYDVLVCGGGTAGCAAAIAAARNGAKTLMIERSFTCGGMLTKGNAGITKYTEHWSDKDKYQKEVLQVLGKDPQKVQVAGGIATEYVDRMISEGTALGTDGQAGSYVFTDRFGSQFAMMDMLEEAGVEVLYETSVCQVCMKDNNIRGVVVWNKDGFTQYLAECVIDATGDADVAALAGVPFCVGATEADIQEGCGLFEGQMISAGIMFRVCDVDHARLLQWLKSNPEAYEVHPYGVMKLDDVMERSESNEMLVYRFFMDLEDGTKTYVQVYNAPAKDELILMAGCCTGELVNGLETLELSRAQTRLWKRTRKLLEHMRRIVPGLENARMSFLPDIGVRETRRIEGDYRLTGQDVLTGRDFKDSIGCGGHPIDIGPLKEEIRNHYYENWRFHIPYRIMLPKGVENLLVTGRSVSATRMASGVLRPTVQCMVMGEAAGTAAALAVKKQVSCRELPIDELRNVLKKNGAVL